MEKISALRGQAFVSQSLADRLADALIDAIERGELPPGTRIREATLARQLGISRGPLREALHRLEGRKLVQYTPNFGMRVAAPSRADIINIFEIREALEGLACRLATERMTDAEIDELFQLLDMHRQGPDLRAGSAYYQSAGELDIHFRIATGSGNKHLVDMLCGELYHFIRIYRFRASLAGGRAQRAFDEHRAIISAMRDRDPDLAESLMRGHIRSAIDTLHATEADAEPALAPSTAG
jgi:DNA-binding GntR family transcriptional regulator